MVDIGFVNTFVVVGAGTMGREIAQVALMAGFNKIILNDINQNAMRSAAGAFKVYSEYIHFNEELISGIRELQKIDDLNERKRRFRLRELIMLQKIVVADDAPAIIRKAISFFGGHGIMEDFIDFPRLHRDSLIMELYLDIYITGIEQNRGIISQTRRLELLNQVGDTGCLPTMIANC